MRCCSRRAPDDDDDHDDHDDHMAILRSSGLQGRCEQCRAPFDPVYGGACTRCRRLLCARDLHGGAGRRLLALGGLVREPVCVRCRERGDGGSSSSSSASGGVPRA
jgi:hypothetical protein